jgi:hypothetical protein
MAQNLKEDAGKAIADALAVLERAYRHAEQVLETLQARLANQLKLQKCGSLGAKADDEEGRLRMRWFHGFYLMADKAAWRAQDVQPQLLKKPVLFAIAVLKPHDPSKVGGMYFLCGVLQNFALRKDRALKNKSADWYLPRLFAEHLEGNDPTITQEVESADFANKYSSAQAKYLAARLVDVPGEKEVGDLADRAIQLWKPRL